MNIASIGSIKSTLGIAVLFSTVMLISACAKTDREKEVYQLIEQGVESAEKHNLSELMQITKDGFTAGPGNRSRQEVRRILFVVFKRFGEFTIHYPKPSVKMSVDENAAIVKMNFLMASKDSVFPELKLFYEDLSAWIDTVDKRADIYALTMELEYVSGSWLVTKATITSFGKPHARL